MTVDQNKRYRAVLVRRTHLIPSPFFRGLDGGSLGEEKRPICPRALLNLKAFRKAMGRIFALGNHSVLRVRRSRPDVYPLVHDRRDGSTLGLVP